MISSPFDGQCIAPVKNGHCEVGDFKPYHSLTISVSLESSRVITWLGFLLLLLFSNQSMNLSNYIQAYKNEQYSGRTSMC